LRRRALHLSALFRTIKRYHALLLLRKTLHKTLMRENMLLLELLRKLWILLFKVNVLVGHREDAVILKVHGVRVKKADNGKNSARYEVVLLTLDIGFFNRQILYKVLNS